MTDSVSQHRKLPAQIGTNLVHTSEVEIQFIAEVRKLQRRLLENRSDAALKDPSLQFPIDQFSALVPKGTVTIVDVRYEDTFVARRKRSGFPRRGAGI
jgi:hypothetical protein